MSTATDALILIVAVGIIVSVGLLIGMWIAGRVDKKIAVDDEEPRDQQGPDA